MISQHAQQMLKKPAEIVGGVLSVGSEERQQLQLLNFLNVTLALGSVIDTRETPLSMFEARSAAMRKLLTFKDADDFLAGCVAGTGYSTLKLDTPKKMEAFLYTLSGINHEAIHLGQLENPELEPSLRRIITRQQTEDLSGHFNLPPVRITAERFPKLHSALEELIKRPHEKIYAVHFDLLNTSQHLGLEAEAIAIIKELGFNSEEQSHELRVMHLRHNVRELSDYLEASEEKERLLATCIEYAARTNRDEYFFELLDLLSNGRLHDKAEDALTKALAERGDIRAFDAFAIRSQEVGPRPTTFHGHDDYTLPGVHSDFVALAGSRALPYLRPFSADYIDYYWQYRFDFTEHGTLEDLKFLKALRVSDRVNKDDEGSRWIEYIDSDIRQLEERLNIFDAEPDESLIPEPLNSKSQTKAMEEGPAWEAAQGFFDRVICDEMDVGEPIPGAGHFVQFETAPRVFRRRVNEITFAFAFESKARGFVPGPGDQSTNVVGNSSGLAILTVYDMRDPHSAKKFDMQAEVLKHGASRIKGQTSSSVERTEDFGFFLQTSNTIVPGISPEHSLN